MLHLLNSVDTGKISVIIIDIMHLNGKTFYDLTVLERSTTEPSKHVCKCICGNIAVVKTASLNNGNTKSCGCRVGRSAKQRFSKHGMKKNPAYACWSLMRDRCNNPNNKNYPYYGGRGISVCKEWDDFAAFLNDMGERPHGMTIERIDNNGNYEPSNCKWASRAEQSRNRDYTVKLTKDGVTKTISEWARDGGNHSQSQYYRRRKRGLSNYEAMFGD